MITQSDMEELRQDCIYAQQQDSEHEMLMRSDLDYFLARSNYENALDALVILKADALMYDRCIHELIDIMKDEL